MDDPDEELKGPARNFHLLQQSPHLHRSIPKKWREVTGAREARRVRGVQERARHDRHRHHLSAREIMRRIGT